MTILQAWVHTPFARAAGWALFHSLWEGAAVAVLLALMLAFIRSSRGRYLAACVALLAILASFGITFALVLPRERIESTRRTLNFPVPADALQARDVPPPADSGVMDRILPWTAPFWLAGVFVFYLRHVASWAAAYRLRRAGVCVAPDIWLERLQRLATRVRLSRPVMLLESGLAGVPLVIGHWRPVILLPAGLLAGLPAGQIEAILLHELAHIRRYDYLVNLLQSSIEALLFYHPLVWWISGVIRAEREHCCDEFAAAVQGDPHAYAGALAALEQYRWAASNAALAATGGSLMKRIRRLLAQPEAPGAALTPLFSAGILVVTVAMGLGAWQATAPAPAAPAAQPPVMFVAQAQPAPASRAQESPYTKWLNEDVAYIVTAEERAAFLRLQTNPEREQFILQFWLRRDPTPGTPENEFMIEHYRRIRYANEHFGTLSGLAGWKTDRGRIYISFGPPDERDEHGAAATSTANDHWRYRFLDGIGYNVNIEFVDVTGSGEYRMTSDPNRK
jgi:GWxTD domain-containing protein